MGTNFNYDRAKNPDIRDIFEDVDAAISAGAGVPSDLSVTNAKLANDVKVGSLAALNTTTKASVVAAINEVEATATAAYVKPGGGIPETDMEAAVSTSLGLADSAYQKPGGGIPNTDMTAAVQASLALADTALQPSGGDTLIGAQVDLGGANPTTVTFMGADAAATILGSNTEPFAITSGQTFVVNPDGAGDVTATFTGTQGTSTSGASPATDMSASPDVRFRIAIDGGLATLVTFDWATGDGGGACDDGTKCAAEMQEKIRALAAEFANVTVDYNVTAAGKYTIKSDSYGTGSSIVVTAGDTNNCTEELKLGASGGGTETAGTGDAVKLSATTAAEAATKLAALAGLTAAAESGKVRITSDTTGSGSSLAVNAACVLDTVFGITGTDYGTEGLGLAANMADANYRVMPVAVKNGAAVTDTYTISNKAVGQFEIYAETAGSTETLDLLIFGTSA